MDVKICVKCGIEITGMEESAYPATYKATKNSVCVPDESNALKAREAELTRQFHTYRRDGQRTFINDKFPGVLKR